VESSHANDFVLSDNTYLLSHSVGRPLKSAKKSFEEDFFAPWTESGKEPWMNWLNIIDAFTFGLSRLFNSEQSQFCPQVNLSSALTKLLMSLSKLPEKPTVLISEEDFPSMGFVFQKVLGANAKIKYIPKELDVSDVNTWQQYISEEIDIVFISHAYSNLGKISPIKAIVELARKNGCLSIIDIAQSAGVVELDLTDVNPDFMIGSSVKWLCGGPGAGYLWINKAQLSQCKPNDVGWFSHKNPFEFDIHNFEYNDTALRFWGGTPSVAPYAIAAHSINYFADLGSSKIRKYNQYLIDLLINQLGDVVVSPIEEAKRSGTVILNFGNNQIDAMEKLKQNCFSVDERAYGIRISPHIYNTHEDIMKLVNLF